MGRALPLGHPIYPRYAFSSVPAAHGRRPMPAWSPCPGMVGRRAPPGPPRNSRAISLRGGLPGGPANSPSGVLRSAVTFRKDGVKEIRRVDGGGETRKGNRVDDVLLVFVGCEANG